MSNNGMICPELSGQRICGEFLADHYALSDDTRSKGMTDLQDLGIITISRQPINPGDFDIQRIRNAYSLNLDALKRPARRQQR